MAASAAPVLQGLESFLVSRLEFENVEFDAFSLVWSRQPDDSETR